MIFELVLPLTRGWIEIFVHLSGSQSRGSVLPLTREWIEMG